MVDVVRFVTSVVCTVMRVRIGARLAGIAIALAMTGCTACSAGAKGCSGARSDDGPKSGSRSTRTDTADRGVHASEHRAPVDALATSMARGHLEWEVAGEILGALNERRSQSSAEIQNAASAKVTLPGYGAAKLPSGAGTDFRSVAGNEGDASVQLYGNASRVRWLSVSKYYAEKDPARFVERVVPSFKSTPAASPCGRPESEDDVDPHVFTLTGAGDDARELTAVVTADYGAKYGPESTTLTLYDHPPSAAELRCMPKPGPD